MKLLNSIIAFCIITLMVVCASLGYIAKDLQTEEPTTSAMIIEKGQCTELTVYNYTNITNVEHTKEDNRLYEYNYNHNFNLRHTPDCKYKTNKYIVDGISMQPFWEDGDEYHADLAPWEDLTPHDIILYNRNGSIVAHAVHYINDAYATTIGYRIFNKHQVSKEDYVARYCK